MQEKEFLDTWHTFGFSLKYFLQAMTIIIASIFIDKSFHKQLSELNYISHIYLSYLPVPVKYWECHQYFSAKFWKNDKNMVNVCKNKNKNSSVLMLTA